MEQRPLPSGGPKSEKQKNKKKSGKNKKPRDHMAGKAPKPGKLGVEEGGKPEVSG